MTKQVQGRKGHYQENPKFTNASQRLSYIIIGKNYWHDVHISFVCFFLCTGVKSLYKGLGPTLVRTFPATGSLFLAYETTKKFLTDLADNR